MHKDRLPQELKEPVRDLRFNAKYGKAVVFSNNERFLPEAGRGNTYYEHDAGEDRKGGRGRFRVVSLMGGDNSLMKLFFTSAHYQGEWTEITW